MELLVISLILLPILFLSQISRDLKISLIQEKLLALSIGLIIGSLFFYYRIELDLLYTELFPFTYILTNMHRMPKAYIYNRLGALLLLSFIGGAASLASGSLIALLLVDNLKSPITTLKFFSAIIMPGIIDLKESEEILTLCGQLPIFFVFWVYPLYFTIEKGLEWAIKEVSIGVLIGMVIGVIIIFLMRAVKIDNGLSLLETLGSTLAAVIAYLIAKQTGGNEFIAFICCCLIVVKYEYISEDGKSNKLTIMTSISLCNEAFSQFFLGYSIWGNSLPLKYLPLLPVFLITSVICYISCLFLAKICKLTGIKLKDCILALISGYRGPLSIYLASQLPESHKTLAYAFLIVLNYAGCLTEKFAKVNKDEGNYLISSNPCSKIKSFLKIIEETYITPLFTKEEGDNKINSPKFNDGTQRIDSGIEMQPDPRDEVYKEIQEFNLNSTENDLSGVMQLK